MRISLGTNAAALAAVIGLAACSGGSSSVPSAAPQAAMPSSHTTMSFNGSMPKSLTSPTSPSAPHIILTKRMARPAGCNASEYLTCVAVSYDYEGTVGICVELGSSCDTGNTYYWYQGLYTKRGHTFKHLVGEFYPNPGNPTTDYIFESKQLKSSHGKIKYIQELEACNQSSSCYGPYYIGISTY